MAIQIIVLGPRASGKTYLIRKIVAFLRDEGVPGTVHYDVRNGSDVLPRGPGWFGNRVVITEIAGQIGLDDAAGVAEDNAETDRLVAEQQAAIRRSAN